MKLVNTSIQILRFIGRITKFLVCSKRKLRKTNKFKNFFHTHYFFLPTITYFNQIYYIEKFVIYLPNSTKSEEFDWFDRI